MSGYRLWETLLRYGAPHRPILLGDAARGYQICVIASKQDQPGAMQLAIV